jgi:ubiquinone/menaquinone biosynthesis C-methylase UbiE
MTEEVIVSRGHSPSDANSAASGRVEAGIDEQTLDLLGLQSADRFLEVGFGRGDLLDAAADRAEVSLIAGVDASHQIAFGCASRFAPAVGRSRVLLVCGAAQALPFRSSSFTKICTVNTIYFWPDLAPMLSEFRRVLRPGGVLAVSFRSASVFGNSGLAARQTMREPAAVHSLIEAARFLEIRMVHRHDRCGMFICALAKR